jgi:hypothetical protein
MQLVKRKVSRFLQNFSISQQARTSHNTHSHYELPSNTQAGTSKYPTSSLLIQVYMKQEHTGMTVEEVFRCPFQTPKKLTHQHPKTSPHSLAAEVNNSRT